MASPRWGLIAAGGLFIASPIALRVAATPAATQGLETVPGGRDGVQARRLRVTGFERVGATAAMQAAASPMRDGGPAMPPGLDPPLTAAWGVVDVPVRADT